MVFSMYDPKLLEGVRTIHFIGCGGSGTYPLIQILHSRGYAITGSDVEETKNTEAERALGVRVCIGHDAANVGNADLVVYSAAIHDDNPELQAARARGIKAVERSVMLGYISRTHAQSIGVAGTHGKTTTTGMITTMLELAGRDPAAVIGGKLPLIGGYGKAGSGQSVVIEACEYHETFLHLTCAVGVILNIDNDHLEYYGTMGKLKLAFQKFALLSRTVVFNMDDKNTMDVVNSIDRPVLSFGIEEEALLATGMPRLDHFLDEKVEKEYREEMADKFPWSAKGRVIVFAPTFRGTGQRTAYYPYDEIDMDRLYRMCVETDTYFVFEMHHFIRKRPDISAEYADRIFDLSDESLTKLFFIADVLVTDYSSCFYDYLLLKKPVVFFVPDKTAYSLIRGVQRSIDEMAPGVVCDTFDEFLDVLRTRHYETVSPHPSSIDRAAERSGLASDRAIDTIIYGKDVPGVRKQASGKGGAVPVRQSDKSAKSERKAKELLDSKVADKDTKSASDEEE